MKAKKKSLQDYLRLLESNDKRVREKAIRFIGERIGRLAVHGHKDIIGKSSLPICPGPAYHYHRYFLSGQ
ncbi:MAG: hypothetical protein P9M00_02495 [Candidatus Tritonobacter lacicola]|nr:hypothetical protein [Candidatus Tritonobacter lacicola]